MKLLQIWNFGGTSSDAASIDEAIERARAHGFDGLLVKALDGVDWMRKYNQADSALASAAQAAEQRDRAHAANLKYYVWTNPLADVDLDRQASMTAEAALASDGLFIDAEPYERFWGAYRDAGLARTFMERIRQQAPSIWIALQPDPRSARLAELRPEEWMPYVDALAGQHYWTDFAPSPDAWRARALLEMMNAAELGQQWGKPVLPTLPGISSPEVFPTSLLRDFAGFVVYRLGTTTDQTLDLLGSITYDQVPSMSTTPPAPLDPFAGLVNALAYVCDTVGDQVQAQAAALNQSGEPLRALVAEMQRVRTQFIGERPRPEALPAQGTDVVVEPELPVAPPDGGVQPPPPLPGPRYNPRTPALTQPNDWACSVFSATMALNSMGVDTDWTAVRADLGQAVTEQFGLMDARGPALVDMFNRRGFQAGSIPWTERDGQGATWDDVLARAGRMPVLLGGRKWYHWTFVRSQDSDGQLSLGNPAPSWKFVGQTMERDEFDRLGPWTMLWFDAESAPSGDAGGSVAELQAQKAQLEQQISKMKEDMASVVQALAHVADVIVPELAQEGTPQARRAELLASARAIREQFVGPILTDGASPPILPAVARAPKPAGRSPRRKRSS